MENQEREAELNYRTHNSSTKDVEFICLDLGEPVLKGHIDLFTLMAVDALTKR